MLWKQRVALYDQRICFKDQRIALYDQRVIFLFQVLFKYDRREFQRVKYRQQRVTGRNLHVARVWKSNTFKTNRKYQGQRVESRKKIT